MSDDITGSTKALLQQHFASIQAQIVVCKAPLEQARAARDDFVALNVRTFEERERLDKAVSALQSDTALTDLERALSATARALGGYSMSDSSVTEVV